MNWTQNNIFPQTYTNSHICKRDCKEDPENYRSVTLTSSSGKVLTEQILLSANMRRVLDNKGIRLNQNGLRKARFCLTDLVTFYDQVTCLVDQGKAVDVVCLDFTEAFGTVTLALSQRSWQPMAGTGALFTGLKRLWVARPSEWL